MAVVHGGLSSVLKVGDHISAAYSLFGSCLYISEEVLTIFGVDVPFADGIDLRAWQGAIRDKTKVFLLKTILNTTMEFIDVSAVCEIDHSVEALVIVDNAFATPVFSNVCSQGVDVFVYSATKHINGQRHVLGVFVLGS